MKRMSSFERLPSRRSFTLVELLLVLCIIAILIGMVLPVSTYVSRKVKEARSEAMRQKIISALDSYRAEYGEYPINNGTEQDRLRHYAAQYTVDTNGISPYTNVNLGTSSIVLARWLGTNLVDGGYVSSMHYCVESIQTYSQTDPKVVDYSLSYPLCIKPVSDGKKPFIDLPAEPIMYMVWKIPVDSFGQPLDGWITEEGIKGNWINRPVLIDPATHHQWIYDSDDGRSYELWLEDCLEVLKKGT